MKSELLNYPVHIYQVIDEEDGDVYFYAFLPDFGHAACSAVGDTPGEALQALENVKKDVIQHYLENNKPLPEPSKLPYGVLFTLAETTRLAHITYDLFTKGEEIHFRIRDQDEQSQTTDFCYDATNGIKVMSLFAPGITPWSTIYLRGNDKEFDECDSTVEFKSETERKMYIEKIHEALKDWDENWEGWAE